MKLTFAVSPPAGSDSSDAGREPIRLQSDAGKPQQCVRDPGQIAGLDSEEGRSLNFTCGEDAATLVVDYGERSKLMVQQGTAISNTVAERIQR